MLDDELRDTPDTPGQDTTGAEAETSSRAVAPRARRSARRPAGPPATRPASPSPVEESPSEPPADADQGPAPTKKAAKKTAKRATKKTAKKAESAAEPAEDVSPGAQSPSSALFPAPTESAPGETEAASRPRRTRKKAAPAPAAAEPGRDDPELSPRAGAMAPADGDKSAAASSEPAAEASAEPTPDADDAAETADPEAAEIAAAPGPLFRAPDPVEAAPARTDEPAEGDEADGDGPRRRRRRGGRRRRKGGGADGDGSAGETTDDTEKASNGAKAEASDDKQDDGGDTEGGSPSSRRRRRRRRKGESDSPSDDDPENTVVRVRESRTGADEVTAVEGSTRLEAKRQRRRDGRQAGRRRAPVLSEAEFLARRESVTREMVVRQRGEITQIAVLEDNVLVEHYVSRATQTSLIGNVYLARVQNVLPSMEAAFVDIGKGRNAVLYAGEVDWKSLGFDGKPRRIEEALSSGQSVLVQVTKDPVGSKGARLTGQVSLAGRFIVYVPRGHTSGISRKLPEGERNRLKGLIKQVLPDDTGVIIRTAAEGATEDQLTRDVTALTARWADIEKKSGSGQGPKLLYGEPDLTIKVIRDLFNEDFNRLAIEGDDAWDDVDAYVKHVAPDLAERLERYTGPDVFADHRVDEQIAKALERKVWLPSGGSLVVDRTEAMTVVDVNTGKFTGSGGNLEETVTRNNLEAAEEVVRQLRLRDIGGIIVVDFIDMVLESNRDLVLRRLVECLGRDRTRHQVAEVTSLGLVQMTRKKIGTGLLEAFGHSCEHCKGAGVLVQAEPIEPTDGDDTSDGRRGGRKRSGRTQGGEAKADKSTGDKPKTDRSRGGKPKPDRSRGDKPKADTATDDGGDKPDDREPAANESAEEAPALTPS